MQNSLFSLKECVLSGKKYLAIMLLSLLVLSFSQSLFLIILRPFLALFFTSSSPSEIVLLEEFFNPRILSFVPNNIKNFSFARADLPFYVQTTLFVLVISKNLASYFYSLSIASFNGMLIRVYRNFLFNSIITQSYKDFCKNSSSHWMSVIMNDVAYLQSRSYEVMNSILKDLSLIISAFLAMLLMNFKLALLMIVILPLFSYILSLMSMKISFFVSLMQKELSGIASCFNQMRKRLDEIWIAKSKKLELEKFSLYCDRYFSIARKLAFRRSLIAPLAEVVGYCIFISVFFLNTSYGFFHMGDSLIFFASLGVAIKPLKSIGEQFTRIYEIKGSLLSGLNIKKYNNNFSSNMQKINNSDFSVNYASFSLQGGQEFFLKDLSLSSGDVVAITGASGSGKTTLLKGLSGLISPLKWSAGLSWESFFQNTVLLPQFSYVFQGSILDNIYYGSEEKKHQQHLLPKHLKDFGLDKTVASLEDGVNTSVSSFCEKLSGGQVQRLVLLRSLMRNKKILLLDEFTSSLDEKTEYEICKHLVRIVKEQGLILVAITHRDKIKNLANKVYHMQDRSLSLIADMSNAQ
jgi:ABC-type multidrug transport system fused ATPase/permease subunit